MSSDDVDKQKKKICKAVKKILKRATPTEITELRVREEASFKLGIDLSTNPYNQIVREAFINCIDEDIIRMQKEEEEAELKEEEEEEELKKKKKKRKKTTEEEEESKKKRKKTTEEEEEEANTCVIWDMNECPAPTPPHSHLIRPYEIYTKISSFLASRGYEGFVEVFGFQQAYDDYLPSDELDALRRKYALDAEPYYYHADGILLEEGDESAIANKKIVAILSWALDNPPPANLVVISRNIAKETYLMSVLRTLKARNYNFLLLQDSSPADSVVPAGSVWRWKQVFEEESQRIELGYKKRVTTVLGSTASCNTGVFWDVDDCSIPEYRTLGSIRQGIVNCIRGYGHHYPGEVTINAYALNAWDVTLGRYGAVYNRGARYRTDARGHRIDIMVRDILLWALDNLRQPSSDKPNLLIIAKDVSKNLEFKAILYDLLKKNVNVVLALPEEVDEGPKVERLIATNAPLHKQSGY